MRSAPFNAIFQKYIIDPLNTIDGVSVLDGYLVHYANDLASAKCKIGFPCVAAQPSSEEVISSSGSDLKGKLERKINVIGAVSTKDRTKVNTEINDLVYSVRSALAIDRYQVKDVIDTLVGSVKYELPESGDQYAFFELEVTISFVERWD